MALPRSLPHRPCGQTWHAGRVIALACVQADLSIGEFSPRQVKQAVVGTGGADKRQVQEMIKIFLNLDAIPKPDLAAARQYCLEEEFLLQ